MSRKADLPVQRMCEATQPYLSSPIRICRGVTPLKETVTARPRLFDDRLTLSFTNSTYLSTSHPTCKTVFMGEI